jgi:mutator family transposase
MKEKERFWGDRYGQTKLAWQQFFELQSERQRDRYAVRAVYQRRRSRQQPYRNGYYERDFVTSFGTIRLRIAGTREKSFLPGGAAAVSAASGRGVDADPGSVLAWDQHAASGAGVAG